MEAVARTRVRLTSDVARVEIADRTYEGLRAGTVIEVPLWAADALLRSRVAEVVDELSVHQLRQISLRERRSQIEPVPLREDFYARAKYELKRTRSSSSEEALKLEEALRDVAVPRLYKVCVAAAKGTEPTWLGNLTPEERQLYVRVRELVEEFLSEVLGSEGDG
ncbi:MAG: hypothetical protein NZ988_05635 [Thaumarchaeota archaeon]|nr:hypothetical protein [Candidatus Calditenuaceae archaeon]MDW8187504.1 hypothetical protein [Nitrososphaerota archaeon]